MVTEGRQHYCPRCRTWQPGRWATGHLCQRPSDGHTFQLTVASRGSYGIMADGDEAPHDFQDADWQGDPWTLEVRAWSLREALELAAEQPLTAWRTPDGQHVGDPREETP